jgi:hypothetical protein
MSNPNPQLPPQESLEQTAIRCYLSTLLAASDCMAQICPDVGMSFKRRWARAPQRIGFAPTPELLEISRAGIDNDLKAFAQYLAPYARPALPLIDRIAATGSQTADAVLERVASLSVLLDTLAESASTIADLDVPEHVRAIMENHAAGLASCARQAENEMLPLVTRMRSLIRECAELVESSQQLLMADPHTGFLNRLGFEREVQRRTAEGSFLCLVRLLPAAVFKGGAECSDEEFLAVMNMLSAPIHEQFRSSESIALLGRQIAVIFAGTAAQAASRRTDITRRLAGVYNLGDRKVEVKFDMDVLDPEAAGQLLEEAQPQPV